MDMTVASTTAITAARQPDRAVRASAPAAASSAASQPATDVVDLTSDSDEAGSGIIARMKVGSEVRTYTYGNFA